MPRKSGSSRNASKPIISSNTRSVSSTPKSAPTRGVTPQQQPAATFVTQPQQRSVLSEVATNAASIAAGHVAATAITRTLFGSPQNSNQQEPHSVQQKASYSQTTDEELGPCAIEFQKYIRCMEATGNNSSYCTKFNEKLKNCKEENAFYW